MTIKQDLTNHQLQYHKTIILNNKRFRSFKHPQKRDKQSLLNYEDDIPLIYTRQIQNKFRQKQCKEQTIDTQQMEQYRQKLRRTIFEKTIEMTTTKSKLFIFKGAIQKPSAHSFSPTNLNKAFTFKSKILSSRNKKSQMEKSQQLSSNKSQQLTLQATTLPIIQNKSMKKTCYNNVSFYKGLSKKEVKDLTIAFRAKFSKNRLNSPYIQSDILPWQIGQSSYQ